MPPSSDAVIAWLVLIFFGSSFVLGEIQRRRKRR